MRPITIAILVVIIMWGILTPLTVSQPNTTIVNNISIPLSITYIAKLINSTTVANKTITHIYNYTLNYQVTKVVGTTVYVNITGNFTNATLKLGNTVYIKKGQYEVNLLYQPLTIYYPFIIPNLIYNTSYGIITPNETTALTYKGKAYNIIAGNNYSVYNYSINLNNYEISASVLKDGIISQLENGSLRLSLVSFSDFYNITLNTSNNGDYMNFISKSYLYAVLNYSTLSNSLIPEGYLQINYPIVFNNDIIATQVTQIQLRSGQQLALPASLLGNSVNFVLYINELQKMPISFVLNVGTANITWNNNVYKLVGKTQVSTPAGTFTTYEYAHVLSQNQSEQLLYFSTNGTLVKEEVVEFINLSTPFPVFSLNFVGNTYLNPFETYHNVFNYSNTTLPFKVINPNFSLTISIVITIIIVAVLVILHKRE
ncbi:hypothetical protein V6M85_05060 [Sulfolobus tengchongensis]|uniref:Thermopsin n=1 Tax=Sulfolobus tengchongensis TaxID=207809 RepID=A0AAX4L3B2_9CREN